jgi:glyoxylase-like metal-dependent hydrolase (beta-lactamase superfamily II)
MIFDKTGKIENNFYMLGTPAMPVYLVNADKPAIFDAGLAFLGQLYAEDIKMILGSRPLEYCFLTHSHFDHCGSVSELKKYFPSLKVVASEKTKQVVKRPNAVQLIRSLTRVSWETAHDWGYDAKTNIRFEPFDVDVVLREGETIKLSDNLTVRALETPGHTWDCLSYYLVQDKILMCSEAAGVPDQTGDIILDCLVDYDRYVDSMKRLNDLDLDVLCLGHQFAYSGNDARKYIPNSIACTETFRKRVEECFVEEGGDLQKVIQHVKKFEYDDKEGPKQLEAAYTLNLESRIKVIQKRMAMDTSN